MKLSTRSGLLVVFLLSTLIVSCSDSATEDGKKKIFAPNEKVKVAIVTNNPEEFWNICQAGAIKGAKDFNAELSFRKPETQDVKVQMDIVNALVRQDIAGIGVSVINPLEQTSELKLIAKKTHFVTMDNDAEKSDRICYIGTDNYLAGKAAGQLVKEALPEGGTIAVFVGQMGSLNAQQRFQGVVDELAGVKDAKGPVYGKYTLHRGEAITDDGRRDKAQTNAAAAMEQIGSLPNVCFVGLYAYNPPAILEAARTKKLSKKVKIVGFDEDNQTLDGIDSDEIYGTIVQDPFNFGYRTVEVLAAEARGDTSKRTKAAVPHRIITKDGLNPANQKKERLKVEEFRKEMKSNLDSVK